MWLQFYQLDLVTPGINPCEASSRKVRRDILNRRMNARRRPVTSQRFTTRADAVVATGRRGADRASTWGERRRAVHASQRARLRRRQARRRRRSASRSATCRTRCWSIRPTSRPGGSPWMRAGDDDGHDGEQRDRREAFDAVALDVAEAEDQHRQAAEPRRPSTRRAAS